MLAPTLSSKSTSVPNSTPISTNNRPSSSRLPKRDLTLSDSTDMTWRFCVAPMIALTDKHCRYFFRLMSHHTLLYSEMITCKAIIHGDRDYLLGFDHAESAVALQLGGSQAEDFARCAAIAEEFSYQEININVGCPSDRVQSGSFGACLMKEPERVAECFQALQENCSLPITIKCRIGIDDLDSFEFLDSFVETLANAGCKVFIIHARIAILSGLSPKENRNIPPLNYERVLAIKQKHPELNIILNGGILSLDECQQHLKNFDGVMLGREIYKNPYLLSKIDSSLFNDDRDVLSRSDVIKKMLPYMEKNLMAGVSGISMARHLVGLFHQQRYGRHWRHFLSTHALHKTEDLEKLYQLAVDIELKNT